MKGGNKKMKTKIIGLFVCMLLFTTVLPVSGTMNVEVNVLSSFNNGTLSGYVKDYFMNPIEGALVRVCFHDTYEEDYTDSFGYYHVMNIPICYCMKNCTASKPGYKSERILLAIVEDTTHDFMLSNGNILFVGGSEPNNYSSIKAAIHNASDGDTVFVYDDSSPYYENVVIGKSINLIGENKETTIIDGRNIRETVQVSGKCDIHDFTITNGTDGLRMDYNSANSTIHNNIIRNNQHWGVVIVGTLFQSASQVVITQNTFKENGGTNKSIIYGGISLSVCTGAKITKNNFIDNNWNAFFFKSVFNLWLNNYWDRARVLPYPILGLQAIIPPIFWLNFDWRPRLTPYEI